MARKKNPHGTGGWRYMTRNEITERYWKVTYTDRATGALKEKLFKCKETEKNSVTQVRKRATEWLAAYKAGMDQESAEMSLTDWLEKYLEQYARPHNEQKTIDSYVYTKNKIIPEFGGIKLKSVTTFMLDKFFDKLSEAGLAAKTINSHRVKLKTIFEQAVKCKIIPENPVKGTRVKKCSKINNRRSMSAEQARQMLQVAKKDFYGMEYIAALLGLRCGLRLSEVFGLKWEDIVLSKTENKINVRRSVVNASTGLVKKATKNDKEREIFLDFGAAAELTLWRTRQRWQMQEMGDIFKDEDYVCPNKFGGAMDGHNYQRRAYQQILKAADIGAWTFHELRHTFATLLLLSGTSVTIVSKMLGHSKVSVTLDNYSHLLPNSQDEAVQSMNKLYGVG